jgi:hypothetical protein
MSTIPITSLAGGQDVRPKQVAPEQSADRNAPVVPRRPAMRQDMPEKREVPKNFESVAELHSFLEHRSRQWSMTIRLMEQQRQYLRSVEVQREDNYKKLAEIMDMVVDTARTVKNATDREGRTPVDLEAIFEKNRRALDQLENVSVSLSTNFLCWRSAWEQYVTTCEKAKGLRAEMAASDPLTDG